jgi:D-sedoheptulose 7-phosphate isomerase
VSGVQGTVPEVAAACEIAAVSTALAQCFSAGGTLLTFGNGGSAACAQHMAAEFVGRMSRIRPPLPAIALTADTALLTAVANDFGFEQVFARQIDALGRPGDVALAISTSGDSANVLAGVRAAAGRGLLTVALTGPGPSALHDRADLVASVRGPGAQRVQEGHLAVGHALCGAVEALLFDGPLPVAPSRLVGWDDLQVLRARWRRHGRRVVWANAVARTLDQRCLERLAAAGRAGDVLVVGVSGPDREAAELAEALLGLRAVDHTVLLAGRSPERAAAELAPDVRFPDDAG